MPLLRYSLALCSSLVILFGISIAQAQTPPEEDVPLTAPISLGISVTETISDLAVFDWWEISLTEGDRLRVEMSAADGLVPLIGLLDTERELVARSDINGPAEPNGTAILDWQVLSTGDYLIVATRDGNAEGSSSGAYRLMADLLPDPTTFENPRMDVVFRCRDMLITSALLIEFTENVALPAQINPDTVTEFYRLTVFGLDGFRPVLRASASVEPDRVLDCSDDGQRVPGSSYNLPGEEPRSLTEDDIDHVAQLSLRNTGGTDLFGTISLTIGSLDGAGGRYIAVLEGLSITNRDEFDRIALRLGPLARDTSLRAYMIGDQDSRLDPFMGWLDASEELIQSCDDAGRRDCEDVPSLVGAEVFLNVADTVRIVGDRFDSGLNIDPQSLDYQTLLLQSRSGDTTGPYTLILIGELPGN